MKPGADLSFVSKYTPKMVYKRIHYHNKKNSSFKGRPSQILIKGWLKTIKDINCNFHAISESWEHGSGSLLFPNPVISSKDCLSSWGEKRQKKKKKKKNHTFQPERGDTHQQFEGCNCSSRINKESWSVRVQSTDIKKKRNIFAKINMSSCTSFTSWSTAVHTNQHHKYAIINYFDIIFSWASAEIRTSTWAAIFWGKFCLICFSCFIFLYCISECFG